jgi:uncharacterized membrane protein
MKPILLSLNLIVLWFGTTAYAGVLWALHFLVPNLAHSARRKHYDQFIPQTTAATRFFTVVVSLMFLSLIVIIVHEWRTRLKWAALAAFLTLGAATFFGTLRILPINHKLKEGVTDQAQLTEMHNRWINLNETRFVLLTLLWIIFVYYIFRKGRLGAAMNE